MPNPLRKLAFVAASTDHGTMIVNRFDQHILGPNQGYGLGYQLLNKASYDPDEVSLMLKMLDLRREHHGDGVVAVDCGANVGVHTIEWAKRMTGWGAVISFEAQEPIYYALAGNIAINNCFNVHAIHAAVSRESGTIKIPKPDYFTNSSFGSLELKKRDNTEFIGQQIDYSDANMVAVRAVHLDAFNLPRLDLIKIDVEGMEMDVLAGAEKSIDEKHPVLLVEALKTDANALHSWLKNFGYLVYPSGLNLIAIHKDDKCLTSITIDGQPARQPASGPVRAVDQAAPADAV